LKTSERGHGISARRRGPRIGEIRARVAHRVSERRGEVHLSSGKHHSPVSVHSVRRPDGHAALALRIPGDSNSWIEFRPPRAIEIFPTGILRIAWKNQTRWSIDKDFAVHILFEQVQIEVLVFAAVVVGR